MISISSHHHARLLQDTQDLTKRAARHAGLIRALVERPEYADLRQLLILALEQWQIANRLMTEFNSIAEEVDFDPADAVHSRTVLVVNDHQDTCELIATVLRTAGFIVRTASDGLQAINAAHDFLPVVIVMDMTMPIIDGLEATRLIKKMHTTRGAHVIAHSARPIENAAVLQLFAAVLSKPAGPDLIVATVERLMH